MTTPRVYFVPTGKIALEDLPDYCEQRGLRLLFVDRRTGG